MPKNNSTPKGPPEAAKKKQITVKRLLPLLLIIAGFAAFFAFGLHKYLSFEQLKTHREALLDWVRNYGIWAAVIYGAAYAVMAACSIPGGWLATVAGGFLFGLWASWIIVVAGATVGAVAIFLAARYAFYDYLHGKAGKAILRMEKGFQENAFNYLLFLRLVPVFPFVLVNLAPAFLGVKLRTYALATFIGIIPGTFVFASVGNGLGAALDAGETPDASMIFNWEILLPIIGLALLALIPVIYKKIKARTAGHGNGE